MDRRVVQGLVCAGLVLLCVGGFHAVAGHEFVSVDDENLVVDNPHVNTGLRPENVRWAFTHFHSSNWVPLAWLSHMLDCALFGLDAGPHHLVSLFLHSLNAILLFLVLSRMAGGATPPRLVALWPSALVAALFAVHPTRVESVAWIAERRDVLSTAFWILAMGSYAAYAQRARNGDARGARRSYVATLLLFALGLMAKPMLVTLPFVFLLLDLWPLGRVGLRDPDAGSVWSRLRPLLLEKIPFFVLSAGACVVTLLAQSSGGSVESLEAIPVGERIANALLSFVRYLALLVWPSGLAVLYPRLSGEALSLGWRVLGSAALLTGLTWLAIRQARARPYLLVGWLWFLGTLVPVIGLVQVGLQSMADRYTYVPYIGLFVALAWGAADLAARGRAWATALGLAAGVVLAALLVVTMRQVGYWKDSYALFERAIAVTEHNATAYDQLGMLHFGEGRFEQAVAFGERAVAARPDSVPALTNLGNALRALGRLDEAEARYARVVELAPDFAAGRIHLALVRLYDGADAEAVDHLAAAFAAEPTLADDPRLVRGYARSLQRQIRDREVPLDEAIRDYRRALELLPDRADLVQALGWLLSTHPDATLEDGRDALELERSRQAGQANPSAVDLDRLAVAYAAAGRFDEAVATAERALEITGESGSSFLAETLRDRLELYRAGRPYREPR